MTRIFFHGSLSTMLVLFSGLGSAHAQIYQCDSMQNRKKDDSRPMFINLTKNEVTLKSPSTGKMILFPVNCGREVVYWDSHAVSSPLKCTGYDDNRSDGRYGKGYDKQITLFQDFRDMAGRFMAEVWEGIANDHFLCAETAANPSKPSDARKMENSDLKKKVKAASKKADQYQGKDPFATDSRVEPGVPRPGHEIRLCADALRLNDDCRKGGRR